VVKTSEILRKPPSSGEVGIFMATGLNNPPFPGPSIPPILSVLTPRELEVLRLMADGLSTKQISAQLKISFKTAACHRYRILQKLCVDSTVTAVRWAIRQGIVVA
jgi:DNA-binding NarL/FixJ family response regulator